MQRSIRFVLLGTFTLRFSTGLTGSMLAFYLAHLHEHGGPEVDGAIVGLYAALFYLAELILSPMFGILSDRYGHHRVMLFGPIFGAVAVVLTGLTTNLFLLGGTRILEGASGAASVPSILGFIALATAGNEVMRGKTAARFEASTLAGLGAGAIVGVKLFEIVGPAAFFLNAALYGVSFLIYKFGVSRSGRREGGRRRRARPGGSLPGPHPDLARLDPGTDLDRRERGHRRVAQPVGLPARQGRPALPGAGPDGRLHAPTRSPSGRSSSRSCSGPVSCTGATGSSRCDGRRSSATASSAAPCWSCRASSSTTSR